MLLLLLYYTWVFLWYKMFSLKQSDFIFLSHQPTHSDNSIHITEQHPHEKMWNSNLIIKRHKAVV